MSKTTHIACILDRSASMSGKEKSVIDSFNEFLAGQQRDAANTTLTLVTFDHEVTLIHDKVPLDRVEPISERTYNTRGSTALLDAIGLTMTRFKKKDKVLMFIETDGEENSSNQFTNEKINKMVSERKERKWDFIFTGAGLDDFTTNNYGKSLGLGLDKVLNHANTAQARSASNDVYLAATAAFKNSDDGKYGSLADISSSLTDNS